jgi:hypothetical protein
MHNRPEKRRKNRSRHSRGFNFERRSYWEIEIGSVQVQLVKDARKVKESNE